jgi:hypothetical protein
MSQRTHHSVEKQGVASVDAQQQLLIEGLDHLAEALSNQ